MLTFKHLTHQFLLIVSLTLLFFNAIIFLIRNNWPIGLWICLVLSIGAAILSTLIAVKVEGKLQLLATFALLFSLISIGVIIVTLGLVLAILNNSNI